MKNIYVRKKCKGVAAHGACWKFNSDCQGEQKQGSSSELEHQRPTTLSTISEMHAKTLQVFKNKISHSLLLLYWDRVIRVTMLCWHLLWATWERMEQLMKAIVLENGVVLLNFLFSPKQLPYGLSWTHRLVCLSILGAQRAFGISQHINPFIWMLQFCHEIRPCGLQCLHNSGGCN